MKGKIVTVLISLFLLEFAMSCFIFDCDPQASITDVKYNSFNLSAWDTESQIELQVVDSVSKSVFGLEVFIDRIGYHLKSFNEKNNSFGFNSAFACSGKDPIVLYSDPIVSAEILVQNSETSIITDVTDRFGSIGYRTIQFNTLEELLIYYGEEWDLLDENREPFKLNLVDIDGIPNSSIFTINIYLESGIVFTEHTNQINFRQ